jgi:FlhB HrpN YscU SpaS Family
MAHSLATTLRGLLANSYAIRVDGRGFLHVVGALGLQVIAAVALPLLLLALAAAAGNLIQHRLVWSAQTLAPTLSKISPIAGLKRLFSKQALANFIKGLLKLTLVEAIMVALLWPQRDRLESLVGVDAAGTLSITRSMSLDLLGAVVIVLALIAAADYLFQYRRARNERADLRRQGCRFAGVEDPRNCRRARGPDRRKPAARARPAPRGRGRAGNSRRALPGGGGDHRLRVAAEPGVRAANVKSTPPGVSNSARCGLLREVSGWGTQNKIGAGDSRPFHDAATARRQCSRSG